VPGKLFQRNRHDQRNSCGIEFLDALTWHVVNSLGFLTSYHATLEFSQRPYLIPRH
jgi:hypothetical protein